MSAHAAKAKLKRQWVAGRVVTHIQVKKVMHDLKEEYAAMQAMLIQAVDPTMEGGHGREDEMTRAMTCSADEGERASIGTWSEEDAAGVVEQVKDKKDATTVPTPAEDLRTGDKRTHDSAFDGLFAPEPKRACGPTVLSVPTRSTTTTPAPIQKASVDYILNPSYGADFLANTLTTTSTYLDQILRDLYQGEDVVETAKLAKGVINNALKNYARYK
jgi:hypothetical protein